MLHGNRTYLLQDDDGQIAEAHSVQRARPLASAARLNDMGRVNYVSVTDAEALDAFQLCSQLQYNPNARTVPCPGACAEDRAGSAVRSYSRNEHVRPQRQDVFSVADALGVGL